MEFSKGMVMENTSSTQTQTQTKTKNSQIQQFFEQWQLYQIIIENNYMMHNEIADFLVHYLHHWDEKSLRVLELGCGDSSMLARVLNECKKTIETYCGIDLSSMALEISDKNMQNTTGSCQLIKGDMLTELLQQTQQYDLILAGYSLHHLDYEEKKQLMSLCHKRLKKNGKLVIYDLLNNDDEESQIYLQRCVNFFSTHWTALTHKQLQQVSEHVLNNDHPESMQSWQNLSTISDFKGCELKFRDKRQMYGIIEMTS